MRLTVFACAVALTLAAGGPVLAQSASQPAPIAEIAREAEIPFSTFTLDNGLRVVVHEDRKAPVVAVHAWYTVGSRDEPRGRTGFAHLFEHIGLFNPTENLPGGLMEPLRAMGATDWNGTTWNDRTNFFQTVPTAALDRALYMESDRMGHLLGALNQERLDNQRGVVQNEKREGDNEPYGLVFYDVFEALFPEGHPYRHSTIGSMADLDAASLEDLRNWHRDHYGPNNAILVLAGDINTAEARPLVERYFGDIPRGPQHTPTPAPVPTLAARIDQTMTDRVANTRLYRFWAVPGVTEREHTDLNIAADVLGGLASSRLDNLLVRGEETAVTVGAQVWPLSAGIFMVSVDVKPGVDAAAVSARLDQIIAELIADGPTADEVQRVATSQTSERLQQLEPVGGFSGKAPTLAEGVLYANDPGFYQTQLTRLGEATPDSVRAAMNRWLSRPVYALTVVPGERAPYEEAAAARPAPTPAAPLEIVPRAPMPDVGTMVPLDFPAVERARLSNGMEVVYARSETVPTTRIALEFNAGVAADSPQAPGTQQLMLNLLTEATTSLTAAQIAETEERLGADVGAFASLDRTVLTLTALSANLSPSLDLLADVTMHPAFNPADIERRRAQQLAQIAEEATQPIAMAQAATAPLIYGPGHPYGRPASGLGNTASVSAVDRDDLTAFHQTWLRPDNAQMFVVSDRPLAELTPLLEARFGRWAAPSVPRGTKALNVAAPEQTPRIVLIDRPQSPQSVIIGAQALDVTGQSDLVVANAANEAIGGGFLSRINQDIRETRGWSYGLGGNIQMREGQALYMIQAPVQSDRTGESIAVLMQQYRDFAGDRGVTQAERDRIVGGNVGQLPGRFETSAAVLGALRSNALYGRPDNYWETLGPRYQALTAAEMDAAARAVVDPEAFVWVVVGDASVVRPQLEALGLPIEVRQP